MHDNEYPQVMTLKQASSYLSISKSHLSNVINRKVPGVPTMQVARIGRRVVIKREWADEWLENTQQEALQ